MTSRHAPLTGADSAPVPRRNSRRRRSRTGQVPWLFVLPALTLILAIVLGPALVGAGYSLTDWDGLSTPSWVGMENFQTFFGEDTAVLKQTLLLAVVYVVGVNVVGLMLALGLLRTLRTRHLLRALFFLPAVVSPLVVAYIWRYILDSRGPLNEVLTAVGLSSWSKPWLGDSSTALMCIAAVMIWQFAGYHMLIYTAGLQSIQEELYDAAALDGAGAWRRFWDITLPLLTPAVTVGLVLSTTLALIVFDQVMALTGGGPAGATETLGTFLYKQAFANGKYGYSAAVALLTAAGICALALLQIRIIQRRHR